VPALVDPLDQVGVHHRPGGAPPGRWPPRCRRAPRRPPRFPAGR